MRYWVYINDKVEGPYDEDKLSVLENFTPDTLICSEEVQAGAKQEWVKASSIFDFDAPAATQPEAAVEATTPTQNLSQQTVSTTDAASFQVLMDKLDKLTNEIEGMKTKLNESVAATVSMQAALEAQHAAKNTPATAPVDTLAVADQTPAPEDTSTHAEEPTAASSSHMEQETDSPQVDLLDEIQIGETRTASLDKEGEEIVLRSALDSFYTPQKQETQTTQDTAFQDLLKPEETETQSEIATEEAVSPAEEPQNQSIEQSVAETAVEPVIEQIPQETLDQTTVPEEITEEQREEIINEITAPVAQENLILQAIEEAQHEEKAQEIVAENTPAEASIVAEPLPVISAEDNTEPQEQLQSAEEAPTQAPLSDIGLPSIDLPASNQQETLEEKTDTIKELLPGKELEDENPEGLISQADLDEAFEKHTAAEEFTGMNANSPLPEGQGFLNTKDDTQDEIELTKGSTYLISDFIPPATATGMTLPDIDSKDTSSAEENKVKTEEDEPEVEEMLSSRSKAAEEAKQEANQMQEGASALQTAEPQEATAADVSVSKVVMENTIRTKRGATMDIKTAPIVHEPADSERIDLTDSGLDINGQQEIKSADFQSSSSKLTKVILGSLVLIVLIALTYVMLAYLQLLPEQANFLKRFINTPSVEQIIPATAEPTVVEENNEQNTTGEDVNAQVLDTVQQYPLANGQTLSQLINARHSAAAEQNLIVWSVATAVEPDNYSILVKVPPENPQSFKISYRFNYNAVTNVLEPTISDSKNLLDSIQAN